MADDRNENDADASQARQKKEREAGRIQALKAVNTPLRFLTLILLVTEALLGVLIFKVPGDTQKILAIGMLAILFALVAVGAEMVTARRAVLEGSHRPNRFVLLLFGCAGAVLLALGIFWTTKIYVEKGNLAKDYSELKIRNTQIETDRSSLQTKFGETEKTITELRTKELMLTGQVAQAREEVSQHHDTIKELQTAKNGLEDDRKALSSKYDNVVVELDQLRIAKQNLSTENKTLQAANDDLKKALGTKIDPERYGVLTQDIAKVQLEWKKEQDQNQDLQETNAELQKRIRPYNAVGLENFFSQSSDFEKDFASFASETKTELDMVGVHFHPFISDRIEELLRLLQRGVKVKVLVLDPYGDLKDAAREFDQNVDRLRSDCAEGLNALRRLQSQWAAGGDTNLAHLRIKLCSVLPRAHMFFFDPSESGQSLIVPLVMRLAPSKLPGFLFKNIKNGIYQNYHAGFRTLWGESVVFEGTQAPTTSEPTALTTGTMLNTYIPEQQWVPFVETSDRELKTLKKRGVCASDMITIFFEAPGITSSGQSNGYVKLNFVDYPADRRGEAYIRPHSASSLGASRPAQEVLLFTKNKFEKRLNSLIANDDDVYRTVPILDETSVAIIASYTDSLVSGVSRAGIPTDWIEVEVSDYAKSDGLDYTFMVASTACNLGISTSFELTGTSEQERFVPDKAASYSIDDNTKERAFDKLHSRLAYLSSGCADQAVCAAARYLSNQSNFMSLQWRGKRKSDQKDDTLYILEGNK